MNNPFKILKDAIDKIPFVKYALGIAGVAAAVAIIKSFDIENYTSIPVISILVMLGFMVLLFIFSSFTKSKERPLRLAGYALVFTTVAITCVSSVFLATSIFFSWPKPITHYFQEDRRDTIDDFSPELASFLQMDSTEAENPAVNEPENTDKENQTIPINPTPEINKKSHCFPFANQTDMSSNYSKHDGKYFEGLDKIPEENIFWKAKITGMFDDGCDCIAAANEINLRLHMSSGNNIKCAKELKPGTFVYIWGTTKGKSGWALDIDIDTIKIMP